jgi:hypothetical protein
MEEPSLDVISSLTLLWCHSKGQQHGFHISSWSYDLAFQFFSLETAYPIDAAEIK